MQLKRNIEPTFESQYSQDRVKNIPSSCKVLALSLKKRSNVHFAGNAGQSGTHDDVQVGPSARSSQAGPADSVPQGSHSTFQAPRDIKGKYTSHGENQAATMNTIYVYNNRDFKAAQDKLKSIIKRNKSVGINWGFKIVSQKNSKFAKSSSHNWKSDNFDVLMESSSAVDPPEVGNEEPGPRWRKQRICVQCKGIITGASWSYLVCRTTGCYNGMSHFGCLGFPDVSTELAKEMKREYECPSCFTRRENAAVVEADFEDQVDESPNNQKENLKQKTKSKKKQQLKTKMSDKKKDLRTKQKKKKKTEVIVIDADVDLNNQDKETEDSD